MPARLKIVVGGYIVGYPAGGMTWHHLNYLLGLQELGHEVFFYEDSGAWLVPWNPAKGICEPDPTYGIKYLQRQFADYGLNPNAFCYYSEFLDQYYGASKKQLFTKLQEADLMICISGITPLRDNHPRVARTLVIDTDPVFTQLRMRHDQNFLNYYRQFDAVATFGRIVGTQACPLPTHALEWIHTNQPIAMRHWPVVPNTSRKFTTLGKWEHGGERHVEFEGKIYLSSKGVEWLKLLELPSRTQWELELAMASTPPTTQRMFEQHGWHFADANEVSESCQSFQDFVKSSAGELTVAKQIYAGLPSGWFSDRAAAYLASGRPVVTQASGFDEWLPVGEGLFSFDTLDEAAEALATIDQDYELHSTAARRIAEQYFDSKNVLNDLIERTLAIV